MDERLNTKYVLPNGVIDFGSNVPLTLARIEGRCHDYARGTG